MGLFDPDDPESIFNIFKDSVDQIEKMTPEERRNALEWDETAMKLLGAKPEAIQKWRERWAAPPETTMEKKAKALVDLQKTYERQCEEHPELKATLTEVLEQETRKIVDR